MATEILTPAHDDGATAQAATAQEKLKAAGYLFSEIAGQLSTATCVLHQAISNPSSAAALETTVCALLDQLGAMADRAADACGQVRMQDPDGWALSPAGAGSMSVLEQRAVQ